MIWLASGPLRLVNRISLRTLTISLVGFLAILAVLAQVLVAQYFRGAAFTAQHQSLTQVVAVASAGRRSESRTTSNDWSVGHY